MWLFVGFGLFDISSVRIEIGQLGNAFKDDAIHVSGHFTSFFFPSTVGKKKTLERQIGVWGGDQRA